MLIFIKMYIQKIIFTLLIISFCSSIYAAGTTGPLGNPTDIKEIIVQNRILVEINKKPISVLDVVKQMDNFLHRYYPQYADSKLAKYHYYKGYWRETLEQMIDNELMIADAENLKITISPTEVREEIHRRFDPNVLERLEQLNLSYEEIKDLITKDLLIQKIQWFRVMSKVHQKITAEELKKSYHDHLNKYPPKNSWQYQFVNIRIENKTLALEIAEKLNLLKDKAENDLSKAFELFSSQNSEKILQGIYISQDLDLEERMLSPQHLSVLQSIKPNNWSNPVWQTDRDGSFVLRIFHLKNHQRDETPPFESLLPQLKQDLLQRYAFEESEKYTKKLRDRFGYSENSLSIPKHFEPFVIK